MQRQVITVDTSGAISGLQRKKGQGLDLRQFGEAQIERASEITWNEIQQLWTVHVLDHEAARRVGGGLMPPIRGATLTLSAYQRITGNDAPAVDHDVCQVPPPLERDWLMFGEYDDAVKVEIEVLDALRLRGNL